MASFFWRLAATVVALGSAGCDHVVDMGADGPVEDPADAQGRPVDVSLPTRCSTEGEVAHPPMPGNHRPEGTAIRWSTNPPSSGDHCSSWGQWGVYPSTNLLPRCNYVHNLEHGGVVLLYNCPSGCPEVVRRLQRVMADVSSDPDCGANKRIILTEDPMLDAGVAAAAWGFSWKADCLTEMGATALGRFISAHLGTRGLSPEPEICAGGSVRP